MFVIYAVILGIVTGYAFRGNLKGLLSNTLSCNYLVFAAIFIQLLIFSELKVISLIPSCIIVVLHVMSYILILLYIIANVRKTGLIIIGIGIVLNSLVIFINGGYMPSASIETSVYNNVEQITGKTLLPWLGDIFHLPYWLPLTNGFSIGDVCITVGVYLYLVIAMTKNTAKYAYPIKSDINIKTICQLLKNDDKKDDYMT